MMRERGQLGSHPKPLNIADEEENELTLISVGIIYVRVLIEYTLSQRWEPCAGTGLRLQIMTLHLECMCDFNKCVIVACLCQF